MEALTEQERDWLRKMPAWTKVRGEEIERKFDSLRAEVERLRDRAVCSGCGHDVGESGVCSYPGCDDGEMIPASDLPAALREMRDRRDEWRQEAMGT